MYDARVTEAVVVAGAPWRWTPPFVALVRRAGVLLAADGGANHLARIGVRPAAVVGDMDSIRPDVRAWLGEARLVHREDQDHTDLHKTLAAAFDEYGATSASILAATGGGLDHALENVGLLARWSRRGPIEAWDGEARIVPVTGRVTLAARPGQRVSLVPAGRSGLVWTEGLRWPLRGEHLDLLERTGVSNRAEGGRIEVRVEDGCLLVFQYGELPRPR